ncbi:MAG TPA: efflux RND transporter permease subunit [Chloroflexota bacterium]|nr:efflux RND transporter permease subunit [Chloroflexota bacterium]
MGLTRLAINRPLAILMFICALVIMGIVSESLMKVDRLPNISFPFVSITIQWPGASPTDAEQLVTKIVEGGLSGISGVSSITSTSSEGRSQVSLQLVEGADANQAAIDAQRAIGRLQARLPADIQPPVVNRADPNAFPVMNLAISGKRSLDQINDLVTNIIQPKLASVLGVADITVSGGVTREIEVQLDYNKLESYGISIAQVTTALQRENLGQPAGSIAQGRQNITIRSMGNLQTLDDIANVQITTGTPNPIRIKDVGKVVDTFKQITRYQRLNGVDAVGLSITKQSDANSLQVANDLKAAIRDLQRTLPSDVTMTITNDSSVYTAASVDAVKFDLSVAVFLTATVLLLFLHSWRNVVIVALAIPTSLLSTFIVMYALGFNLDTISLMALALLIGILVDDSIVVLENIHRHIGLGEPVRAAALSGRSEIGLAAIAITLCDVVVYLPVAFMQGNLGKLFKEYGITIAVATLFSLFIGFTLTPMLASRWLKEHDAEEHETGSLWSKFVVRWEAGIGWLSRRYRRVLSFALDHRPLIVAIGVTSVVIVGVIYNFRLIGFEYAPNEDTGSFRINLNMPPGTNLDTTDKVARQLEATVQQDVPEAVAVYTSVGGGGFGGSGTNSANIDVQLTPKGHPWWLKPWEVVGPLLRGEPLPQPRKRSVFEVIAALRPKFAAIPDANIQMTTEQAFAGGGGQGLQVRLLGDDLNELQVLARQIEQVMRQTPGVADVRNNSAAQLPEVRAVFNRQRMAELGITSQQVATALRTAITGTVVGAWRPEGQDQLDLTLIAQDADRLDLNKLADLPLTPQAGGGGGVSPAGIPAGTPVRLGQVATFVRDSGPFQIQHQDRQRTIALSGVIPQGATLGDVARLFRENMARQIQFPAGYSYILVGQAQQLDVAVASLLGALGLSVLLIYMLLVALFESWLHPLAIMFSLPVSLIGAFTALIVTGNTFNIFSMIGMIMLMGLAAKNAILLVDFTNTLRGRGLARREAIETAGPTRLRPILMTTCTILFAMLPLAAKLEEGAESRAPMAVVVMGGVISSTFLTLVFVPVMYTYLDDLQAFFSRRGVRAPRLPRRGRPGEPLPVPALAPELAGSPGEGAGD